MVTIDGRDEEQDIANYARDSEETSEAEALIQGLGQRIMDLRTCKGWTRTELATALGVSRDRLAKWECGLHAPPLEMMLALRTALGISVDELITGQRHEEAMGPARQEELKRHVKALDRLLGGERPTASGPDHEISFRGHEGRGCSERIIE